MKTTFKKDFYKTPTLKMEWLVVFIIIKGANKGSVKYINC